MKKAEYIPVIENESVVRPTRVEINLSAIKHNFYEIKKLVSTKKIMAILKANAYGHGLFKIAQYLESLNIDYLGVAVLEEGILLRNAGIKTPILVLGGILGNQLPIFIKYNLTITASSIDKLSQIDKAANSLHKKARVHLKIDTGMERIGVHYYNSDKFFEASYKFKNIEVEGVYSHLANSESVDSHYTEIQLERFSKSLKWFEKNSIKTPIRHIANSGAICQYPESYYDMVRPGLSIYGVSPNKSISKNLNLIPALSWKSQVVYFKVIKPGHPVGYGSTWQSDHNIRAVTIPVGYGDGYFRNMSGKAAVIINGNKFPVIGNISMDQIVVNIENKSAYNSDEVILIGTDKSGNKITVEDLAQWANTIPYEILTNINTRVPRIYFESE